MKVLLISCAALGYQTFLRCKKSVLWNELKTQSINTVFPALTCPVQASLRTGLQPTEHGILANGFYECEIRKTFFWEQSSALYKGERFWEDFRKHGGRVAQICFQQSLGNDSDIILSPAPIHKHHGGMIQSFYSKPSQLYDEICNHYTLKFNLFNYWGPFTSAKSTHWIACAAQYIMEKNLADLVLVYLPHLDYDLQRYGIETNTEKNAFSALEKELELLLACAKKFSFETVIVGDYAIENAKNVIYPNKILRSSGLFRIREVKKMLYPDFHSSQAFALCDHQIALVYLANFADKDRIKKLFSATAGIKSVSDAPGGKNGDLILSAEHNHWFSYRWWNSPYEAPDYATHVDIHNKPGFDPCELFLSYWPPTLSISTDDSKVRGTHGLADGESSKILLASSLNLSNLNSICELSKELNYILKNK